MTAEIAVLNRSAVALAADSASTFLQASGLPKIFNTTDKLFHLDGVSPIGVMVYGNSTFMGVPWETVIKRYRGKALTGCRTLEEAAKAFCKFLCSTDLLSDQHLRLWFESQANELAGEAARIIQQGTSAGSKATPTDIADQILSELRKSVLLDGLTDSDVDTLVNKETAVLDKSIDAAFAGKLPDDATRKKIRIIIALASIRVPTSLDSMVSGIVIAGFGEDELFPVLWNCQVRSVLENRMLQQTKSECEPLTLAMSAMIRPFAQYEMAYSFLYGIDPELRRTIEEGAKDLFEKFGNHLAAASGLKDQALKDFQSLGTATAAALDKNLRDQVRKYCQTKHIDPVLAAIGLLPKDQLAYMAETLVSLTSFKRKMSRDAETVGGDVDVAVISKGDGFIWVKRKHYFPADLNLRYIKRIEK
jgi:hypothetical protein